MPSTNRAEWPHRRRRGNRRRRSAPCGVDASKTLTELPRRLATTRVLPSGQCAPQPALRRRRSAQSRAAPSGRPPKPNSTPSSARRPAFPSASISIDTGLRCNGMVATTALFSASITEIEPLPAFGARSSPRRLRCAWGWRPRRRDSGLRESRGPRARSPRPARSPCRCRRW